MKRFSHVYAKSVSEAVSLLGQDGALVVAGGTDLLRLMKVRHLSPPLLVNISRIVGLKFLQDDGAGLRIGATTNISDLADSPAVQQRFPGIAAAAGEVATPQIRNMGTVAGDMLQRPWCLYFRAQFPCFRNGGSQCYAAVGDNKFNAILGGQRSFIVHPSDLGPALIAHGASITLQSARGSRTLALDDFFTGPEVSVTRENVLAPDEIATELRVPDRFAGGQGTYLKVRERDSWDHALVSVAAVAKLDGGTIKDIGIVLGGVAPKPWRATEAEKLLAGKTIDEDLAGQAGEAAVAGARPLKDNGFKVTMARNMVKRAVLTLAGVGS